MSSYFDHLLVSLINGSGFVWRMTEETADTVTARYNIIQHSIYNYIYIISQ